jgi:hypothetical protein
LRIAALLAGVSLSAVAAPAQAQNINTISQWDGSSFVHDWGVPNTATYGQTITPTATQTRLSSFTFELGFQQSGTPVLYQAFVYQWNPVNNRITGPALFSSSPLTSPTTAVGAFQAVTINTGNVQLTAGQQYVLFFTTSSQVNAANSIYRYGAVAATAYAGGNWVFSNNGTNFASLSTTAWSVNTISDLAFIATFGALPGSGSPPGLPLIGVNGPINPSNVASAVNAFINAGGTLPPQFLPLLSLSQTDLLNALNTLTGEAVTGAQQPAFQLMNEFLGIMLDPFVDGRAGVGGISGGVSRFAPDREPLPEDIALAYSKVLRTPVYKALPFEQRWSVWGAGYGGANRTSGDPLVVGSHDLSAHTAGGAAGLDYRLAPGTIVGFALAGGGTGWSLTQNLGSGRGDAFQAGIYAKTYSGPFYLAGALAYTQHWMSTDRIAFAGDRLQAQFNAESFGGRAEAGYRIANPIAAVTPYAAVQAQSFHTPTYNETDVTGGGFGLTYNAHNARDTRTELGARFDRPILLNWNAVLALRARVAWAHDWITDPNLIPTFEALPGASFLVQGATPAKNSALTSAGAELRLVNGISVLAKFDGQFATHSQTYGGSGAVRYVW